MKKYILSVATLFLGLNAFAVDLATIPTEYNVRCGLDSKTVQLKFSTNFSDSFECRNIGSSKVALFEKQSLDLTIGTNTFKEVHLGSLMSVDQIVWENKPPYKEFSLKSWDCQDLRSIDMTFVDRETKAKYDITVWKGGSIEIKRGLSEACSGFKK